MSETVLRDNYGRTVTYLRVSVTDRCNLRCFYCWPNGHRPCAPSDRLPLTDLAEAIRVGVTLGIRKIRITGGEPLLRPGVVEFVRALRALSGIEDLALSTNGTLLAQHATALATAGLMRVNVSLDSLRPAVFRAVSGRAHLDRVLAGLGAARTAGLRPIKLNVVVVRGVNDDELPAMLAFAQDHGAQVRFIEYMPLGQTTGWDAMYVPRAEILERIRDRVADLGPRHQPGDAAAYYPLRGGGEVGVISPVSCRFCDRCNRLRLTADGRLRPCLTREGEVDMRPAIRLQSPDAIAACFRTATGGRPRQGVFRTQETSLSGEPRRPMAAIGG